MIIEYDCELFDLYLLLIKEFMRYTESAIFLISHSLEIFAKRKPEANNPDNYLLRCQIKVLFSMKLFWKKSQVKCLKALIRLVTL